MDYQMFESKVAERAGVPPSEFTEFAAAEPSERRKARG